MKGKKNKVITVYFQRKVETVSKLKLIYIIIIYTRQIIAHIKNGN